MTTTYTFINATAARLFAEWWRSRCYVAIDVMGCVIEVLNASPATQMSFYEKAEAFNAAARSAREIGEERKPNEILADTLAMLEDFQSKGFDLRGREFDGIRDLIRQIAATEDAVEEGR